MNTSATNRKVRVLLRALRDGSLQPRPEFQRRLVWSNSHKQKFLETVLQGYPFPEIYIAAGDVDPDSGDGNEMLVDGQQRVTTLNQYFLGLPDLRLGKLPPYTSLPTTQQLAFLEYEVVVRDLGPRSIHEIKEIFTRINSTRYALNAMEIHNARFDGELKRFGEQVAEDRFFDDHAIFKGSEVRRMGDLRFALVLIITMVSSYFNRDDPLEEFLERFNDQFPEKRKVRARLDNVFRFVDAGAFERTSRFWQRADLLTGLIEIDGLLAENPEADPHRVAARLATFYKSVDVASSKSRAASRKSPTDDARAYYLAAVQASNDRSSRIRRGEIVARVIRRN